MSYTEVWQHKAVPQYEGVAYISLKFAFSMEERAEVHSKLGQT